MSTVWVNGAVSPIIRSAPKCCSRHFVFHRKWVIFLMRVPSKPALDFLSHKPFYSRPKYSSWWLGICLVLISSNVNNRVLGGKQQQQQQGSAETALFRSPVDTTSLRRQTPNFWVVCDRCVQMKAYYITNVLKKFGPKCYETKLC